MLCCVCHWSCCLWLRQRFFQHLLQYHICHCLFFTLSALRYFPQCGVKYYSQRVCGMWSVGMSVCMCKSSSQKLDVQTSPNFSACCLWSWLGPRLATLHTLCTSGFVDARWCHVYPLIHRQTRASKRSSKVTHCILLVLNWNVYNRGRVWNGRKVLWW